MAQKTAVVQGLLPAAAGSVDITSSGFGTVAGAIIIACNAASGATPAADCVGSVGFWDGTNQRVMSYASDDAGANSNTSRSSDDALAVIAAKASGIQATYSVASITDGIRLTMVLDATGVQRYVTVILFGGVSVLVGTFTPNATQNATQASDSLGFAPKLAFFATIGTTAADADRTSVAVWSFGWAEIGGTHRAMALRYGDGVGTETASQKYWEDRCVGQVSATAVLWSGEVTAWGADTFTMTTRDAATGSVVCFFMALGGADISYDTLTFDTRTTTGDTVLATDVTPESVLLTLTTNASTTIATNAEANGLSFGLADANGQFSHATSVENAATVMSTDSAAQTAAAIDLDSSAAGARTDLCSGTAALNAADVTLTYSTVDGTARKGFGLVFGPAGTTAKPAYYYAQQ